MSTKKSEGRLKKYLKGVRSEFKRVTWPTRKELLNYTLVVLAISALTAGVVSLFDLGIRKLLSLIVA